MRRVGPYINGEMDFTTFVDLHSIPVDVYIYIFILYAVLVGYMLFKICEQLEEINIVLVGLKKQLAGIKIHPPSYEDATCGDRHYLQN